MAQSKRAELRDISTRRAEAPFVEPETVSRRAYELFQERGREPGHELDDWLRAERELKEANRPDSPE